MNRVRALVLGSLAALFVFAVALACVDGRKGYMPLDHSIVFDGAWRVLCGQVPYRDFTTPNGLAPMYLQAPLFALLGPTWFAYVLHAALANGAFALLVYALLRRFALERPFAWLYAAASAVVFYPPIGVPYMEQESFLFSLAALVAAVWATAAEPATRRANVLWAAAVLALAAAALSKQIPAVFALPVVLVIFACGARAPRRSAVVTLVVTALAIVAGLALVAWLAGVDAGLAFDYAWRLPRAEGAFKLRFVDTAAKFFGRVQHTVGESGLLSLYTHAAAPALALVAFVVAAISRERRAAWLGAAAAWSLATAAIWTCVGFVAFAGNQWQNGVPFAFLAVGLVHAGVRGLGDGASQRAGSGAGKGVSNGGGNGGGCSPASVAGRGAGRGVGGIAGSAIGLALALLAARDAWRFECEVNRTRLVNDLVFSPERAAEAAPHLPSELAFLAWNLPPSFPVEARDFAELAAFLRAETDGFVLLGDFTILHALARKEPLEPCLWLHPGLSMPWPDDPAFAAFDARWAAPFLDGRARWLVLQGEETFTKRRLEQFPALAELVGARGRPPRTFGAFRVLDLAP
ncbi:MAG: hypothetical protein HZA52_04800 [Planctomycetes bacterium]|nr:hypothetical protein [Planctomycetota bacterium]